MQPLLPVCGGFVVIVREWVPCCLTERLEYLILITDYDGICLRVGFGLDLLKGERSGLFYNLDSK